MKILFENTQPLMEDKVVKFNGQTYPKFGWAVILMGGGGSGKGSAFKKLVPIDGKYMNIDDLKENPRFWDITNRESGMTYKQRMDSRMKELSHGELSVDDVLDPTATKPVISYGEKKSGKNGRPVLGTELKDSDYTNELHQALKPLGKKLKQQAYDTGKDAAEDRLPNVIFDIVADELSDIQTVVNFLKPRGYKIAIVWMLSTAAMAKRNNKNRDRAVPEDVLVKAHGKVINTARELFASDLLNDINNFWVINTYTPKEVFSDDQKYHDFQNVFQIPTTPDGFDKFKTIFNKYNPQWNQSWKTGKNTKEYQDAKPFNVTRRMNQQTKWIDKELNK